MRKYLDKSVNHTLKNNILLPLSSFVWHSLINYLIFIHDSKNQYNIHLQPKVYSDKQTGWYNCVVTM